VGLAARAHDETARAAPQWRRGAARGGHARRARKRAATGRVRVALVVGLVLALVLGYVGMTAEVAAQTYQLSADQSQHAQLQQTADALRQRLAQSQSLSRLERAALDLRMTPPASVVYIPVPVALSRKLPLPTLAARIEHWLRVR